MKQIRRGIAIAPIGPGRHLDAEHMIGRRKTLMADLVGKPGIDVASANLNLDAICCMTFASAARWAAQGDQPLDEGEAT
jgi:hypothetical protein